MAMPEHDIRLLRGAYWLEWATAAWMLIEAGVAISAGIAAHSLLVLAFGIDSIIELASAGVLIWRLSVEMRSGTEFPETIEHRASRIAGALLLILAAYVIVAAVLSLINHQSAEFSLAGLIISLAAIPVMYFFSRRKLALADALDSLALRADAVESVACAWFSFVVVIGLFAQLVSGAWWIDAVASLVIVYLLIREGLEAWEGGGPCR